MAHEHEWIEAGECEDRECDEMTYDCKCGAYKLCDGDIYDPNY